MDLEPSAELVLDPARERDLLNCRRKQRHASKGAARAARDILRRTAPEADFYPCDHCKGFHISKLPAEHERLRRRASAEGEVVAIHYDPDPGVTLGIGDGLQTSTGRTYLIIGYRVQQSGKRAGRYHLMCAVNQPITGRTHPLVWYKRDPGADTTRRG